MRGKFLAALTLATTLLFTGCGGGDTPAKTDGDKPAATAESTLKIGATVSIPNDPTNGGRALLLLQKAGLLQLKDGTGAEATVQDIVDNPKNLVIQEVEAAQLPRTLEDVDISIINTNFALNADLNPMKDALFIEDKDSPYVNIIAVRDGDENREDIKKLLTTIKSDKVKKFITEKYQGAIVPAF